LRKKRREEKRRYSSIRRWGRLLLVGSMKAPR
jgi:hypothetical protein